MISLVVSVLFLALVLLTSGGTTASGEVDNHEEWGRRIRELRNSGKQEDAIALAEEYREKVREAHGVEHPRYAIALKVLANILQNTDRTQEAEALLRQSLTIEEKSFGPQHPRLIPTLTELALFLSNKEQIAEARQVFFRLLSIQQSVEVASNQLCNSERQQKVDSVKKQKVEAYRKLENCRIAYEKTKTFFTLETMDERCKQQKAYADRADSKYRAASAMVCPKAAMPVRERLD